MQAYCEGRQKVPVYVPSAVEPSLVTRDIRAPKENAFIVCLFKAQSEANALIEHCLVLCHFFYLRASFLRIMKCFTFA